MLVYGVRLARDSNKRGVKRLGLLRKFHTMTHNTLPRGCGCG